MKKKYSCHICGEDIYVKIKKKDFTGPRRITKRNFLKIYETKVKYKKCPSCGHLGKIVLTGKYEDYTS